ncbi:MAG: HAMP domain-containing sensor histidine kinase [Bacteroidales bacterium]|nr:HAMP domain-containing sensor histidine kinase [Bacteroidales bacterium]
MKRFIGVLSVLALLFLMEVQLGAQNNKYKIDDSCYAIYRQADSLLGKPEAAALIDKLEVQAKDVEDDKAYTLAAVLKLRNATRFSDEELVLECFKKVRQVAEETGFLQYYFYAYQLIGTYYFNKGMTPRGLDYLVQMHDEAERMDNDYGKWLSSKTLAEFYLADYRRNYAYKYFNETVHTYLTTDDPTIKVQSMTKVYVNLAFTSGFGTDRYDEYMDKALDAAKISVDTLLVYYGKACSAAMKGDKATYKNYRDMCLSNKLLPRAKKTAPEMFTLTDSAFAGKWDVFQPALLETKRLEDLLYISDLAAAFGNLWLLRDVYDNILQRVSSTYESQIAQSMAESQVMLENDTLNRSVIEQKTRLNRLMVVLIIVFVVAVIVVGIFTVLYIKQLNKAKEEADTANRMKTSFVQNMSHEIRTPLNAVVGYSQLLALDPDLSEEEKDEYMNYVNNNASMLMMLIDDILDLSDMENGNYKMSIGECACNDICRMALKTVESKIPAGVSTAFETTLDDSFTIRSDERRIQQVLINFLTNACKHTTEGYIKLVCSLALKEGYVSFAVEDTGSGIAAKDAELVFQRFSKLDKFKQGSGLGLNICRALAEKLGGIVELDRSYGRAADDSLCGARFLLHIKL